MEKRKKIRGRKEERVGDGKRELVEGSVRGDWDDLSQIGLQRSVLLSIP